MNQVLPFELPIPKKYRQLTHIQFFALLLLYLHLHRLSYRQMGLDLLEPFHIHKFGNYFFAKGIVRREG